jgi:hypothetical protein
VPRWCGDWHGTAEMLGHSQTKWARANRESKLRPYPARQSAPLPARARRCDPAAPLTDAMCDRLQELSLSLHPDETRLIEFGRSAAQNSERRGFSKPETFKLLGFVLICERRGDFQIWRKLSWPLVGESAFARLPCRAA